MTTPFQPGMYGDEMFAQQAEQQMGQQYAARVLEFQRSYEAKVREYQAAMEQRNRMEAQRPGGILGMLNRGWEALPDAMTSTVEKTLSGLYWAYSRFISQPVSFTFLMAREIIYNEDKRQNFAEVRDIWKDAKHMSPGQSLITLAYDNDEMKARGIDFENNVFDKSWFKEGSIKKGILFNGGWSWQKILSGSGDLAVAWYADPLVLVGKGLGVGRQVATVKPVDRLNLGAREAADYERLMKEDTFQAMIKLVSDYKVKYGDEANVRLASDMKTMRESTDGEALANLLTQARNDGEMADILRISLGDTSKIDELAQKKASLGVQANTLTQQNIVLSTNLTSLSPAVQSSPLGRALQARVQSNEAALKLIDNELDSPLLRADDLTKYQNSLENLYFNQYLTPVTTRLRTALKTANKDYRVLGGGTGNRFVDNLLLKPVASTVYNGLYVTPLKIYRYFTDVKPPLFVEYADNQSWRSVDAALAGVRTRHGRASDEAWRQNWTSRYQGASIPERMALVRQMEEETIERIARSFGTEGGAQGLRALYAQYAGLRGRSLDAMRRTAYTTARTPEGKSVASIGMSGENEVMAPILRSQLENDHVLMDFEELAKVARRNAGAVGRVLNGVHPSLATGVELADWGNRVWKFSKLFSIAYGIRTVSDDFLSMISRFGASAMIGGHRALAERYFRGRWLDDLDEADLTAIGINKIDLEDAARDLRFWTKEKAKHAGTPREQLAQQNIDDLKTYIKSIEDDQVRLAQELKDREASRMIDIGGLKFRIETADPLFRSQISSARSHERLLSGPQGRELRRMRGSSSSEMGSNVWRPIDSGQTGYTEAWHRVLMRQYRNDELAMTYIRTGSIDEMEKFLRSPAGREYMRGMPKRSIDEQIEAVRADIDDMIPPMAPYADAIRAGIMKGDLDIEMLRKIPNAQKPPRVREELTKFNLGSMGDHPAGAALRATDRAIENWYKIINTVPTDRLIRNPMAAALYRSHLMKLLKTQGEEGVRALGQKELLRLEEVARKRTIKDIKGFSFSLDHQARAAWGMRFVAPFFGAKIESFQRWGRVILDRPQVVGHAGTLFNTPLKAGVVYDRDGNLVGADGYVTDPNTGERRLVPKDERMWRIQLPGWASDQLEKAYGYRPEQMAINMDSLNLTLQDDPIWSPSYGPLVQMPAKVFAQHFGGPAEYETLKNLGILPLGSGTEASLTSGPTWMSLALKAGRQYFDSDARNSDAVAMMRQMDIEYRMGLRSKKPTIEEAREKANKFSWFKVLTKITTPFSAQWGDSIEIPEDATGVVEELKGQMLPFQFFSDEYAKMQNSGMPNADQAFLDKYGESFFAFTVAMSRNNTGMGATNEAVDASQRYRQLLDEIDPDLHALVVGPEGIGPFSQEAYYYQLNTETKDGSGKTQRERMSPREYQEELERRSGWNLFSKLQEKIKAEMLDAGFTSFDDKGAENFAAARRGLIKLLTSPELTARDAQAVGLSATGDRIENPYYNRSWEQDWNQQDHGFYARRIADLRKVAATPELDPRINTMRADIRGLREYLVVRDAVADALSKRESDDINAKSNADIKQMFRRFVFDITERNIAFAELHNRYLARDLGVDMPWE